MAPDRELTTAGTRSPRHSPSARSRSSRHRTDRSDPSTNSRRPLTKKNVPRGRIISIFVVIAFVYAVLGARLFDIQVSQKDQYQEVGLAQRSQSVIIPSERGSIFDRNGNALAVSVERMSVWADPRVIKNPDAYARKLAPILGVEFNDLANSLGTKNRKFVYLARQVEPEISNQVKKLNLAGVSFTPETKRYYPAGDLAIPVLGFVGTDNNGLSGLEVGQESQLAGKPGKMSVEKDPQGQVLPDSQQRVFEPKSGRDLVLTIDQSMQYEVERVLVDEVTLAKAKGGIAVLADVRTGEILAMANVNGATTDVPAHPAKAGSANRALVDVFEPGSTNKVVTIAAAIEAGLVNSNTTFEVPSALMIDGTKFEDVHSHSSQLSVADILRISSNVGTILIAKTLGADRFDAALRSFGFGQKTKLNFPGEASGILLPRDQYNSTSMASMPVGSGLAVTAMQMLQVYLTIANGGISVPSRLISATIDANGERHKKPLASSRRVVSESTAATLAAMLEGAVSDGTGIKASVTGYRVSGKTGTARKPPYEKPPYRYVASFVGFAPTEAPRLAAIVVLDEPQINATGGLIAAPTFSRIIQYALAVDRVPATS